MYAILNIPGSSHFEYHGPDTRTHCQRWLDARVAALQARGEQPSALWPQRVLANRLVERWRYLDGSRVVRHPARHARHEEDTA
jgi:hypothetical protein